MSFTKVAPAGIGTEPGTSILIGDSLLHSTGIDIGSNTGIGVTIRKHGDATFTGIVTAKEFRTTGNITAASFTGDISNATGQASGLGTALSQTQTDVLNKVYYTDSVLRITSNTVVDTPPSAASAYTNYAEIKVDDGNTFTVRSGDEFKLNVLGIGTLSNY
jgi:hypothetical protein